jgi:hypothetical protein
LTRTNALAARLRRAPAPAPERFRTPWDALNARDYAAFVELLREAGCPEDTVRAFAIAALGRDYQRRIEEPERARVRASVYWRDEWRDARSELPKEMLRQRAEMNATLARLLGASVREIRRDFTSNEVPRDWLADDRREQLDTLLARQRAEVEAFEESGVLGVIGTTLDESLRTELKTLREQHRVELKQLLGADGLVDYESRESIQANYVRQHLPPAKSEEEFRLLVQAARDVGFTESEISTDTLPPEVQVERPGLRERVLARFREISDPDRAMQLQDAVADEDRLAEEKRKAEDEASSLADLQRFAKGGGLELSDDEARSLSSAIRRRGAELDHELGDPGKLSDVQRDALMQRLRVEFEQVAVDALGDKKGRAIVDQMWKERGPGR